MANEQNLIPFTSDQSREEAKKNGQKGGIASGKARRERKLLKDYILDKWDKDKTVDQLLIILHGGEAKDSDFLKALEFARDTVGEKPIDKVMVSEVEPSVISEVENIVLGEDNADKGTST